MVRPAGTSGAGGQTKNQSTAPDAIGGVRAGSIHDPCQSVLRRLFGTESWSGSTYATR